MQLPSTLSEAITLKDSVGTETVREGNIAPTQKSSRLLTKEQNSKLPLNRKPDVGMSAGDNCFGCDTGDDEIALSDIARKPDVVASAGDNSFECNMDVDETVLPANKFEDTGIKSDLVCFEYNADNDAAKVCVNGGPSATDRERGLGRPEKFTEKQSADSSRPGVAANASVKGISSYFGCRLKPKVVMSGMDATKSKDIQHFKKQVARKDKTKAMRSNFDHFVSQQTRALSRKSTVEVPQVGMRVKVKFEGNETYDGTLTRVRARRRMQPTDEATYKIQIHYDDNEIEDATYSDPDISFMCATTQCS